MTTDSKRKPKTPSEHAAHCLGHRIRVEALTILIERAASPKEIAAEIGESLELVSYHLKILREGDAIELVGKEPRGPVDEHFYRATMRPELSPELSQEEWLALSRRHRQELAIISIRNLFAETLASVENENLVEDEEMYYWWKAVSLDPQGREEMRREQDAHTARILEIEARSNARTVEAKGTARQVPTVLAVLGFDRARRQPVNDILPE